MLQSGPARCFMSPAEAVFEMPCPGCAQADVRVGRLCLTAMRPWPWSARLARVLLLAGSQESDLVLEIECRRMVYVSPSRLSPVKVRTLRSRLSQRQGPGRTRHRVRRLARAQRFVDDRFGLSSLITFSKKHRETRVEPNRKAYELRSSTLSSRIKCLYIHKVGPNSPLAVGLGR